MKVKLVVPAGLLADHTVVTKPTGDKQYTIHHKIPIFNGDRIVSPREDSIFLVANGDLAISEIGRDKEVMVHFDNAQDAIDALYTMTGDRD